MSNPSTFLFLLQTRRRTFLPIHQLLPLQHNIIVIHHESLPYLKPLHLKLQHRHYIHVTSYNNIQPPQNLLIRHNYIPSLIPTMYDIVVTPLQRLNSSEIDGNQINVFPMQNGKRVLILPVMIFMNWTWWRDSKRNVCS